MPKLDQKKLAEMIAPRSEQYMNNNFAHASSAVKVANNIDSRVAEVGVKFKEFAMTIGELVKSFLTKYKVGGPDADKVTSPKIGVEPTPTPSQTPGITGPRK